jgi:hypothetical protein
MPPSKSNLLELRCIVCCRQEFARVVGYNTTKRINAKDIIGPC